MGYISDPSAGIFYGHFRIASQAGCLKQYSGTLAPGEYGKSNALQFANQFNGIEAPCGTADNSGQAAGFFKYDANTGHLNFLGAPKSENPSPYGWSE